MICDRFACFSVEDRCAVPRIPRACYHHFSPKMVASVTDDNRAPGSKARVNDRCVDTPSQRLILST